MFTFLQVHLLLQHQVGFVQRDQKVGRNMPLGIAHFEPIKCVFFVPKIETFKVWFQVRFRAEDPNLTHPFAVGSTGHSFGGCRFKQLVGFK